jgi:hypothetical protein
MLSDTLYDTDYYAWTQQQAALLAGQQLDALDREHLLEELHSMRTSLEREFRNRLRVLLYHLLKLQHGTPYDLERAGPGWQKTVRNQRDEVSDLLADNPSLSRYGPQALSRAWDRVRRDWDGEPLPETCPWSAAEVLRDGYFPEPA